MSNVRRLGLSKLTPLSATQSDNGTQICLVKYAAPRLGIIFVHGLRGHPRETWEDRGPPQASASSPQDSNRHRFRSLFAKSKPKETTDVDETSAVGTKRIYWPQDLLAEDLKMAQIYTYGYNADLIGGFFEGQGPIKNSISQYGNDLMVEVASEIRNEKPIIFVTHSLGGIIVKDALRRSKTSLNEDHQQVHQQTRYVVFMGTPHRGAGISDWGVVLSNIAALTLRDVDKTVLRSLKVDSEVLDNIHEEFVKMLDSKDFKVHTFVEGRGMSGTKGFTDKVVADFSSKLGQPAAEVVETIDANHMQMCRYRSREDEGYRKVLRALGGYAQKLANDQPPASYLPNEAQVLLSALEGDAPSDHLELVPGQQEGTLQWLRHNPVYMSWITDFKRGCSIMWLRGDVGCGKSVAMKSLLLEMRSRHPDHFHAYFFCDGKDDRKRRTTAVLRSIINQFATTNQRMMRTLGRHEKLDNTPTRDDAGVLFWFEHLLAEHSFGESYWIIVDGVDEMIQTEMSAFLSQLDSLHRALMKLSIENQNRIPVIKIVLSSRPPTRLDQKLKGLCTVDFEQHLVKEDIALFVGTEVSRFGAQENFKPSHVQEIERELIHKSEGMFLWTRLAWERFQQTDEVWNNGLIRDKIAELRRMPRGLVPLLLAILAGMKASKSTLLILEWVVCAARPLTIHELEICTNIQDSTKSEADIALPFNLKDSISRLCGPLVRLSEFDQTVQLVHTSVREFFHSLASFRDNPRYESTRHFHINPHEAGEKILRACLQYLCLASIAWGPVDICPPRSLLDAPKYTADCSLHGFLAYSSSFWAFHLSEPLVYNSTLVSPESAARAVALLPKPEFDVNTPHANGRRLIHIAVEMDWRDILGMLLDRADVDCFVQDDRGWSPLHIACYWLRETMAMMLIKRGGGSSAICLDRKGRNALHFLMAHRTSENVAYEIIRDLPFIPPQLNLPDDNGQPLLLGSIEFGWDRVFSKLIALPGIDLNITDRHGRSAIHIAAICSHNGAMETLISKGADVDRKDVLGRTPLHYAAAEDSMEVMQLLLSKSDLINEPDEEGLTPMHFAMSNDLVSMMKALLERGADPNSRDQRGMTPFLQATLYGQLMLVKSFLANPICDTYACTHDGNGAIHWAAKGHQVTVLHVLLDSDRVDASAVGRFSRTVAHLAAPWAHVRTMKRILQVHEIFTTHSDAFGQTCLHKAAENQDHGAFLAVLEAYLQEGGDINARDKDGMTALHVAACHQKAAAVAALLRVGVDSRIVDNSNRTAEYIGVEYQARAVLQALGWRQSSLALLHPSDQLQLDLPIVRNFSRGDASMTLFEPILENTELMRQWLQGTLSYSKYGFPRQDFYHLSRKCHLWLLCRAIEEANVDVLALLVTVVKVNEGECKLLRGLINREPNHQARITMEKLIMAEAYSAQQPGNLKDLLAYVVGPSEGVPLVFQG
ncbi:uncharacterized protein A1O5_13396 [Cladophialophora psammophila CBS 110553]|uniref:NACHT domain-containing protein n=1 Tax=Cladophialophora psammophila CBS 110553 TaxID=1182543 RepID=W9VMM5_9EURO|nr:uncharacterized protein A1O5_13396 [Cladophialophora psammophila CBS 110553]EXJ53356.1 hypothetical protein A1O5_13396 [Cladophialophora psammophila CBS 110553]